MRTLKQLRAYNFIYKKLPVWPLIHEQFELASFSRRYPRCNAASQYITGCDVDPIPTQFTSIRIRTVGKEPPKVREPVYDKLN